MKPFLFFCLTCISFMSCDVFDYNPHEIILEDDEKDLIEKGLTDIQQSALKDDTIMFIMTGDTQGKLDEDRDFTHFVNSNYPNLDYILICGDLTNYGLLEEFRWLHRELKLLEAPYIPVIGNHDFIANGPTIFKRMYGPFDYSFNVGKVKFIAINTNSIEFGYDGTVPNIAWLKQQLADTTGIDHIIVFSHVMPWDDAFDPKLEKPFTDALKNSKTRISFHGHHHEVEVPRYFYGDEVAYVVTASTGKRTFILVKLWNDAQDFSIERVYF